MAGRSTYAIVSLVAATILVFSFAFTRGQTSSSAPASQSANVNAPAKFKITTEVVNDNVGPFSATIGAFGNCLLNNGFEAPEYRTRIFAEADDPDRVIASARVMSVYDSLREGFLDGADVRVYRVIGGKVELVRTDKVAAGGHHGSGWTAATGERELVAQDACQYSWKFAPWSRPGATEWFSVTAVAKNGAESKNSEAAKVDRPMELDKESKDEKNQMTAFNPPKNKPEDEVPQAPTEFKAEVRKDGQVIMTWKPVQGVKGYRVYYSDYPPESHKGNELVLAGKAKDAKEQIKTGDWVVVGKTMWDFSRNRDLTNRVWGAGQNNRMGMPDGVPFYPDENPKRTWQLEKHAKDSPVTDGGQTALKMTLKDSDPVRFAMYNHAGTGQTWYDVLKPGREYVVEVWLKQEGMEDPTFKFFLTGFYSSKIPPITFKAEGEWKKFTGTFSPKELYEGEGGVGQMALEFKGPGTVWMDGYKVYAKDTAFDDYQPYEYENLAKSGMNCLRTHGFIKTGTTTYRMEEFTNPAGQIEGIGKGNTLPQTLAMMRKAKVIPWLQVEMHMAPAEWLGFVEYMAAPYDPNSDTPEVKPWAFKRFSQGQAKPWTDEFEKIRFELSNETWNWLFSPWVFEAMTDGADGTKFDRGEFYGLFQEYVYGVMSQSPYWKIAGLDKKFEWVVGGWAINNYGTAAASRSPHTKYMTIAAYNGGWDEGEGPAEKDNESLSRVLLQVPQAGTPRSIAMKSDRDKLREKANPALDIGTYEAGPGYALSGLNGQAKMTPEQVRAQEEAMKSLAGGTATLDTFLDKAYYGCTLQNFFTFYHGRSHWVSHTVWHKGALAHPPWMTLGLFNNEGTGQMVKVETMSVPAIDLPAYKRRKAAKDVPLAACYATKKDDRWNVFVLSRKIDGLPDKDNDGFTPVTIELPFEKATKITLFRMVGNPRLHNLDTEKVKIEKMDIPAEQFNRTFELNAARGADAKGLAPGSTLLYVFEGTK